MAVDDNPGASHQSTSAQLRDAQNRIDSLATRLVDTMAALAASQADLTATRGRVVDLLYIIDAFQIESGADREASYETGIAAVRQLHAERDLARAELASARQELEQLRARNTEDGRRPFWGES